MGGTKEKATDRKPKGHILYYTFNYVIFHLKPHSVNVNVYAIQSTIDK